MIKAIKATNFMSWDNLEFSVTNGVTHITGWNYSDNTSEACHAAGQMILMYDGSLKSVENIKINDQIAGPDSKPRRVHKLHRGYGQMYRIIPNKGESFVVNDQHILSFVMSSSMRRQGYEKGDIINISVQEYLLKSDRFKQDAMLYRAAQVYYEKLLLLDPYIFGLWLGDGASAKPGITTADYQIAKTWIEYGRRFNLHVNKHRKKNNKATDYCFTSGRRGARFGRNHIFNCLRGLNVLNNKHIPLEYKTGSIAQRLELLAGLLDTDGYLHNNCFDIIQKNQTLAKDIAYVARSVGLAAYISSCQKSAQNGVSGTYYRVSISGDCSIIPTKLPYKQATKRSQCKNVLRSGVKIEQLGKDNYYGFQIDGDNLYLLGDFTVTHNCGKSAIFNALCWGLFGFTAKDTAIDDVVKEGHKNCSVFVTLDDGTVIERSRKPNDLAIWGLAAAEPKRGKDSKETQKMIEQLIGFSYETFLQSVYFAQNGQIKFLSANEENKAKIIADLADLSAFDAARKKAHELGRDLSLRLLEKQNRYNDLVRGKDLLRSQIELMHSTKTKLLADKERVINDLKAQLTELDNEIQYLSCTIPELSEEYYHKKNELIETLQTHKNILAEEKARLNMQAHFTMQKRKIEKEIKDLQLESSAFNITNKEGQCPTCGTHVHNIAEAKRKSILQEYKQKIEVKLQELSQIPSISTKELQENHDFYAQIVSQMEVDVKEVELIETTQKTQKDKLIFLRSQREKLNIRCVSERNKDVTDVDSRIKLLEKALNEQAALETAICAEIESDKTAINRYSTLKDGFREVKMWAFQDILNELNYRANGYLADLFEQRVELSFTNTEGGEISKIKTSVSIDGEQRALGLFSGGQTRRLMLAVDLALSDIVQARSSRPINLLILDEYFKDLSEVSMGRIYSLLESRKGAILLVEHNSLFKGLASNTFEIEYRNGTSSAKNIH